jgi:hypothetical protein
MDLLAFAAEHASLYDYEVNMQQQNAQCLVLVCTYNLHNGYINSYLIVIIYLETKNNIAVQVF